MQHHSAISAAKLPLSVQGNNKYASGRYARLAIKYPVFDLRENRTCSGYLVDHQDGWLPVHSHSELAYRSVSCVSLSLSPSPSLPVAVQFHVPIYSSEDYALLNFIVSYLQ